MAVHPLPTRPGQHPVDRMADLKRQIADLEREFATLRSQVVAGEVSEVGEAWTASIALRSHRSIRMADAERLLPAEMLEALVHTSTFTTVALIRRGVNRPRRKRKSPG